MMSVLDYIVASFSPPESEQDWEDARDDAETYALKTRWFLDILEHHRQIVGAFKVVKSADTASSRKKALSELAKLWLANTIAAELAIYPALSARTENGHAKKAFAEKACAKMQLGRLEYIDPMTQEFKDKLGHLECGIKHHMYQEESIWFVDFIESAKSVDHDAIARRYNEEFDRYMGKNQRPLTSSQGIFIAGSTSANRSPISARQPA